MLRRTHRLPKINYSVTQFYIYLIFKGWVYGIIHKAMSINCYNGHIGSGDSGDPTVLIRPLDSDLGDD